MTGSIADTSGGSGRTGGLLGLGQGLVDDPQVVVDVRLLQQVGEGGLRLLAALLPRIGSEKWPHMLQLAIQPLR
jgi:hypothetical protein